ncbi:hypothetical protein Bca4012_030122 [Brassica carinata]
MRRFRSYGGKLCVGGNGLCKWVERRGHSQATLTSFGRQIAHHSLHFRALEPCFNVFLNRLPPIQTLSFRLNPRSPMLWSQL